MKFQTAVATTLIAIFVCLTGSATVRTWTGNGTSSNWDEGGNWQNNTVPSVDDDIVFPEVAKKIVTNNLTAGIIFHSITITGTNYLLTGNGLGITFGLTNTAPSNTFQIPLTLVTNGVIYSKDLNGQPFTIATNLIIFGNSGTNILFLGGNIDVTGNISARQFQGIECDSGILNLTGNNGQTVSLIGPKGMIRAGSSNALGSHGFPVVVESDSTNSAGCLELINNITISNLLILQSIITNAPTFSPQILSKSGSNIIIGPITITNTDSLNPGLVNICVSNGNLTISNTISGPTGIAKYGNGQLTYDVTNTYSGLTYIGEGMLLCATPNLSVPFAGDATVYGSLKTTTNFNMNDGHTLTVYGTVDLDGHTAVVPILNGNGTLTLNGGIVTIGTSLGNGNYSGTIAGPGRITKHGTGSQTLSGTNTQTFTTISAGTFVVNGIQTNSGIRIVSNTVLQGTGYCGSITNQGGQIGTLTPWGTLHVVGNLIITNGAFATAITNTDAYGQLDVTGTITLTNANLLCSNTFFPSNGTIFTLIKNNAGNPVAGTFTNAPEGATLAKMVPFQLSYFGGAGNDITLVHTQPPSLFSSFLATSTAMKLTGTGLSNATYTLEASTNLIDWASLSTLTAPATTFSFTNPITTLPLRFYRIKTL